MIGNYKLKTMWAVIAPLIILISCFISDTTIFTTVMSLVGVFFVIGVAYRIPETNLLGAVLCFMLGVVSYGEGFLVNAAVNLFILAPLQLIAYLQWLGKKWISDNITGFVIKNHLKIFSSLLLFYIIVLGSLGSTTMPLHDAVSGALIVMSTFLLVSDNKKQWYYWIPANTVEFIMWTYASLINPLVIPVAVMRAVFFINSLIGAKEWGVFSKRLT